MPRGRPAGAGAAGGRAGLRAPLAEPPPEAWPRRRPRAGAGAGRGAVSHLPPGLPATGLGQCLPVPAQMCRRPRCNQRRLGSVVCPGSRSEGTGPRPRQRGLRGAGGGSARFRGSGCAAAGSQGWYPARRSAAKQLMRGCPCLRSLPVPSLPAVALGCDPSVSPNTGVVSIL